MMRTRTIAENKGRQSRPMMTATTFTTVALLVFGFCGNLFKPPAALTDHDKQRLVLEMYAGYRQSFPDVLDISAQRVMEVGNKQDIVFVDTRTPEEQQVSMIPGAITQRELLENLDAYRNDLLVGYCTISYRSGLFAQEMREQGVTLLNLQGGILGWIHAGGQVFDAHGETRRVHVYGEEWSHPPAGYESVW